ncbi:DUF892 family protein [Mucilaginibacter sp. SMC90]|uniref:DUF892 family protein n=1 Tax=Mucilaginibacter sp. SMC90 TaxID=2929803 RepID=UPI001FB49D86|nr:DUF892 family protein [Mucilaginibacter sp. SMC90]UOE52407.1 DUF892 family protein [Mucilaginibacter sp. SMC90]
MEKFPEVPTISQQRLTRSEKTDLFITILSDVHNSKVALINHLPFFVSRAYAKDVKLLLLESATIINGQLIRVCLTKNLLGLTLTTQAPMLNGCLNLEQFLKENINSKSPKTDVIILTHLIIAEGIEIDAFRVLLSLAKNIKPKSIVKLMSVCCKEAHQSKKALKAMLALH